MKFCICYNMDAPWKHYAKWNKSDTKGHIVWFHLYELPRIGKFTETESSIEVMRGWRRERNGELFNEYEVSVLDNEEVLEMDSGDACTILWMFLMLLNCTLKNGKFYVMYILPQFLKKNI